VRLEGQRVEEALEAPELEDQRGRETGQVQQGVEQLHRSTERDQRGQQIHEVLHHRGAVPRQELPARKRARGEEDTPFHSRFALFWTTFISGYVKKNTSSLGWNEIQTKMQNAGSNTAI